MLTLDGARDALTDAYRGVSRVAESLNPPDFLAPTLCAGWAVCDVLFHLLLDAQRALVALASPATRSPDVDFVTYWRPFSSEDEGALAHARAVRIGAMAFDDPRNLAAHWTATAEAALRVAARAGAEERITTQGHILAVPDFLATLAVEAAIHHLDMTAYLADAEPPGAAALRLVRETLDGLLGGPGPASWTDREYVLKGTGRMALGDADRSELGEKAGRFPLFS